MTKEEEEKIHKIVENMSDEEIEDRIRQDEQGEEEAIEYIKKRIKVCNENADICDDNNFNEEATYLREESYMLETVLNMLKEKDKEIENLKENIDYQTLCDFLISSVSKEEKPVWTEEHIEELLENFEVRWKDAYKQDS